jgi:hypothetical protein
MSPMTFFRPAAVFALGVLSATPLAVPAAEPAAVAVVLKPRIMLSPSQEARLRAEAEKGIDALRRYVWRTRIIHNYYLPDLI